MYLKDIKADKSDLESAFERMKKLLSSMSPGNSSVAAVFDSDDLKESIRKLTIDMTAV